MREDSMAVYDCYRGHTEGIATEHEGHFVIKDDRGRDWFCFESSMPTLSGVDREALVQEKAKEMAERTARLFTLGIKNSQSACTVVECSDRAELPRLLAASKEPGEPNA